MDATRRIVYKLASHQLAVAPAAHGGTRESEEGREVIRMMSSRGNGVQLSFGARAAEEGEWRR